MILKCHALSHLGQIAPVSGGADNALDKRCIITGRGTYTVLRASKVQDGGCMDLNVRAFRVVQAAISDPVPTDKRRDAASKGGRAGGLSRAKSLSAERRREIAKKASAARWSKP
jgi:hypothetical protein